MSDTVTIKTDAAGYVVPPVGGKQEHEVHVTTFWGGDVRGRMVQIGIGDKYVCVTGASADAVSQVVGFASRNSIADYPDIL